ncbi:MAG: AraC family transcriptional regulator ligand-binding domain-containing protein [Myxococcota bacterium]|nr:AraC family transcriptional regulator ligand-binding domain-containing protein [Myxococcota bacterium]
MPASYFRLFLRRFGRSPDEQEAILDGTGVGRTEALAAGPDATIELWQQLRQLENLTRVAPASWALDVGPALQGSAHGALGAAVATAPDLGEALRVLDRFAHVRAPYFRIGEASRGSEHQVSIELELPLEPGLARPMLELLALSLQALIESALGEPMSEARFRLPFAPPSYAERYGEALHAPVAFGAPALIISIPAGWLRLPCPFADTAQHRAALEALEAQERALQGPSFIVAQVERIFAGCPGAPPGADEVARRLHLSRRTLVRRLAACGASFRELADGHRRRRAEQLLGDESLSVSEVGDRLGYTEPANFGRAVRRWFGTSPSALRGGR